MKKIIVFVLTAFTFLGCGEDLQFNTPSFQVEKDGNLWDAVTYRANIDNTGVLTIVASDNLETITLVANNTAIGIHDFVETISSGTLVDIDEVTYTTNNIPDPSIQIYPANGQIDLKEVNIEQAYVSGEFYFNAFSNSGLTSINFSKGFFFKVPLLSAAVDTGNEDVPCSTAEAIVAATLINYNAVMPGDTNFVTVCLAYQAALETQKESCGDPDGDIQAEIDSLSCI